ncbi:MULTISPECIES: flagellar basal body-associated protein FliL [unclassified Campylobacter]|uniref:flagellar basal body-associated protein FliL n=1 Tax=unclassified Campylobacter TaxID=2593542 RepID=UPI001BD9958B|nr:MULTISPECIES: flagellar basal body-associated protein FliL [unclassified Campylobacter]MBZ7975864.1 flagellar basal body-associated protein FliL [Campylobacter sp. RM12637]MBZ7978712.1 flagellar basal body-associated protein FliL [Campylobacter sp. RM12654]MBZ7980636.1 flagellar basal body-associated protein FliL [Campylobacter sp. RM12642]MBZ7981087.1 flagellar basal body-associated protein FliL [Campylobacter sp. RM12640]MBZ7989260.1 flagellar basal body-associated protein FliL [Campyloba
MAENEEVVAPKSKGSSLVLILVTVLLLVVLIIGGLVIFLLMGSGDEEKADESVKTEQVEKKPAKKKNEMSADVGVIYPLDGFTVNLVSDSGTKYLKCKIELEQNIETLTPELDKKIPIIKDKIIETLSSKSVEEISTGKGKERLKEEIINKINEVLNDGFIKNIYFTDFVIT